MQNHLGEGRLERYHFDGLFLSRFEANILEPLEQLQQASRPVMELAYVLQGELVVAPKNQAQPLLVEGQETYLAYLPHFQGTFRYLPQTSYRGLRITMTEAFIQKHHLDEHYPMQQFQQTHGKAMVRPQQLKVQEVLAELLNDHREGTLKRLFLEAKVLELLTLQLDQGTENVEPGAASGHVLKKMYEVRQYIGQHLDEQHTLPQLARLVGINESALKREFKRVFGQTVFEYAQRARMEKARHRLAIGAQPIYEIAEAVGYKNSTHFTTAFKKYTGLTPKAYRKQEAAYSA